MLVADPGGPDTVWTLAEPVGRLCPEAQRLANFDSAIQAGVDIADLAPRRFGTLSKPATDVEGEPATRPSGWA